MSGSGSIAFCFLLYSKLDNPKQWDLFFKNVPQNKYTIYSHLKIINEETQDYISKNAIQSIETEWGTYSLLEASLLLYHEALKNKNNKHIILLSGACIPIYSFDHIYNELMSDNKSRIHGKYLREHNIWAASQWMTLSRDDALSITRLLDPDDKVAFDFKKYWIRQTDTNGRGFLSGSLGSDEVMPINWFIYIYSLKDNLKKGLIYSQKLEPKLIKNAINSNDFQKHIKIACTTFAYFKKNATSPINFSNKHNLGEKMDIMCNNCIFSRKFSNDKNTFVCSPKRKKSSKKIKINNNYWGPMYL